MNNINILFYSMRCETCSKLFTILQNENLLSYFKLVCVDQDIEKYSRMIVVVPTMIIKGINKQLGPQECFEWVQQIKFIKQKQIMDVNKKIIQQNVTNNPNMKKGPLGYVDTEMGGISDQFAYTKTDNPIAHAYFGIGDEDKNVIFTAPDDGTITKDTQHKLTKAVEQKRAIQDREYAEFMKQEQMKAVIQAEQEKLSNNQ